MKGVLLRGTCDLPAKAEFLNMAYFNGKNGCQVCYCEGCNVPVGPNSTVHVYPYDENIQLRTLQECINYARLATPQNPQMGIKGPNAFSKIMPDFIRGMGIDKMHGVEGGVVKKMLFILFDSKYSAFPFSLYNFIDLVNSRLMSIKPPKFVHRMPRNVQDLVHWKASELKLWFFYYSIPVLNGIMRHDYFQHYLLLVTAIVLLDADVITPDMIRISKDLLYTFVQRFEILYGLRFCTINIHQLLHLPDRVETLGPLWSFSCFEFENLNRSFLKLVHGTWHIDTQIIKSHIQFIKMSKLIERLPEGEVRTFLQKKKKQVYIKEQIDLKCYSVGRYKRLNEKQLNIVRRACQNSNIRVNGFMWQYFRLLKKGILYVAETYPRVLQTKSDIVQYHDGNQSLLGSVAYFIKIVPRCDCMRTVCECMGTHYSIVGKIVTDGFFTAIGRNCTQNTSSFLRRCHVTNNTFAIAVENLDTVCVHVDIDNEMFVGIKVNTKELE